MCSSSDGLLAAAAVMRSPAAAAASLSNLSLGWLAWVTGGNPDVTFEVACYFAIVVDGIKLWTPGQHEPPNVQTYSVVGLDAIEVYRGAAELPVQYQGVGSACGAVLLWTRS